MTGFEPLIAAGTAGLTALVTDIIKGQGTNALIRLLSQDIGRGMQQAYFNASKKYIENYAERHGSLKVLGMREPVSLDSVYTTVQTLDTTDRSFASIEDLEQAFRAAQERRFRFGKESRREGLAIANEKQYLMVLGAPGCGKSTFLRKMGLEALKGKQGGLKKHSCIPVLLELKRFDEPKIDIQKIIAAEFEICGFPNANRFTQKALEQGKLLILLDGLDEVPAGNRDVVIEAIQDFVDQHDKNRYIASCRIAAYRHNFRRFIDVTIAEFNDDQIQQFIDNWFQSQEDQRSKTAKQCWQILQQPENSAAKELAHTPLLLTFICLVYDRSQTFSNNRATLYRKALRILLEEWASEKRILREEIYQGLSTELEEVLLSEVATSSFDADRLFLSQKELVNQIKTFLETNLNAPKHLSGETVLNAIAVQQGVLVERAENVYSFSHLTLQEYLTARYIVDHRRIKPLVVEHLNDRRWREVFLLVSGSMVIGDGADELLRTMNQTIQVSAARIPALQALLRWIQQITTCASDPKQRAAELATVLVSVLTLAHHRDLANASANARASSLTIGLARDLANDLAIASANAIVLACDLASANDRDFANASAIASASDIAIARARASDLTRDLANAITSAFALAIAHVNASDLARGPASDLARGLARDLARDLASARASASASVRDLASVYGHNSLFIGVDLVSLEQQLTSFHSAIPEVSAPIEKHLQFFNHLEELYINTFKLDPTLLKLTVEEFNAIGSFLEMNQLMVQCQREASRVSPQVWESILATMLTPANTP
jgi:hypothetical protein